MDQQRRYRGTDHPRLALDLLRTKVHNQADHFAVATRNAQLGLCPQDGLGQDVMHTLFSAIDLATVFAKLYADEVGRPLADVVDDVATQFELTIPDQFRRGSIEDELRKRDGNQEP